MTIGTALALHGIRCYQRYLSPRKGFACAYRVHMGRRSCSALGVRVVRRHGLLRGLSLLHRRLNRCGVAYRNSKSSLIQRRREAGFLDFPCDLIAPAVDTLLCCGPCDIINIWNFTRSDRDDESEHARDRSQWRLATRFRF